MRLSVWPSPARPWEETARIVAYCDGTGWYGAWFADHFMPDDPGGSAPKDGPVLESFAVLAALSARTANIRIGSLVVGNLYRHPAVVANAAATIDQISGGRFVLGLGAGWQVNEHAAYGIDLLSPGERADRLEEACAVIRSLLGNPRTTFAGEHYSVSDAPCQPGPVRGRLPLLVGGGGEKRTLKTAARFADEWNSWTTPEVFRHKVSVLERHCEEVGRDPSEIRRSTQAMVFLSKDEQWLSRFRGQSGRPGVVGTPGEVVEQLAAYAEAGVDEFIVPDWTMGPADRTIETLELFREEVAPHLGGL
ncbi:MAG TPA: TIGR03560 family F420-dependent LLM class oxidoreductase [Acidimicrobiales bacterium]|nr:TIGR03560 family F420-dependent LLM class oxidoreductase [Acidimicrobiales bacterium]